MTKVKPPKQDRICVACNKSNAYEVEGKPLCKDCLMDVLEFGKINGKLIDFPLVFSYFEDENTEQMDHVKKSRRYRREK